MVRDDLGIVDVGAGGRERIGGDGREVNGILRTMRAESIDGWEKRG